LLWYFNPKNYITKVYHQSVFLFFFLNKKIWNDSGDFVCKNMTYTKRKQILNLFKAFTFYLCNFLGICRKHISIYIVFGNGKVYLKCLCLKRDSEQELNDQEKEFKKVQPDTCYFSPFLKIFLIWLVIWSSLNVSKCLLYLFCTNWSKTKLW